MDTSPLPRRHKPLGMLWVLDSRSRMVQLVFPDILALNPHEQRERMAVGVGGVLG